MDNYNRNFKVTRESITFCLTNSTFLADSMSYTENHYNSTYCSRRGDVTSAIAEVAAGTPKALRYSFGTRFEKFSSYGSWTVRGLTTLLEGTTSIESVPFSHQNSSEWCMVLTKQSNGLYLSFLLQKCETEKYLNANIKAFEILPSGEKREVFPGVWCSLSRGAKSEQKLIRNFGISENEDEITLNCEICIQCIIQDKLPLVKLEEPLIGIMQGLDEMFEKEVLTDFELHAGGTVLKAHRALLCVRSPYFAAMLQPHTKEAKEGFVEISDVKPEVLKQVLLHMYKGVAPALKTMPWDLLIAADKYQLQQLKAQCENHIATGLTVDNAAETAANAQVFSCDVLWDRTVLYIKQNLCGVFSSPGWHDIIATHPEAVQCISQLIA